MADQDENAPQFTRAQLAQMRADLQRNEAEILGTPGLLQKDRAVLQKAITDRYNYFQRQEQFIAKAADQARKQADSDKRGGGGGPKQKALVDFGTNPKGFSEQFGFESGGAALGEMGKYRRIITGSGDDAQIHFIPLDQKEAEKYYKVQPKTKSVKVNGVTQDVPDPASPGELDYDNTMRMGLSRWDEYQRAMRGDSYKPQGRTTPSGAPFETPSPAPITTPAARTILAGGPDALSRSLLSTPIRAAREYPPLAAISDDPRAAMHGDFVSTPPPAATPAPASRSLVQPWELDSSEAGSYTPAARLEDARVRSATNRRLVDAESAPVATDALGNPLGGGITADTPAPTTFSDIWKTTKEAVPAIAATGREIQSIARPLLDAGEGIGDFFYGRDQDRPLTPAEKRQLLLDKQERDAQAAAAIESGGYRAVPR